MRRSGVRLSEAAPLEAAPLETRSDLDFAIWRSAFERPESSRVLQFGLRLPPYRSTARTDSEVNRTRL
jgi:hypothetical protein